MIFAEIDRCNLISLVSTVKEAVQFLEAIHVMMVSGKVRSVNESLKVLKKDRKTVDRFKHIYYMYHANKRKLDDVSVVFIGVSTLQQKGM